MRTIAEIATKHMASGVLDVDRLVGLVEADADRPVSVQTIKDYLKRFRRSGPDWHSVRLQRQAGYRASPERLEADRLASRQSMRRYRATPQGRRYGREYTRARRETDVAFRLRCNLSNRLRDAIRGSCKSAPTAELIGCPIEFLRLRMELLFEPGMTWENYGTWHVDHVRPCASFDLTDARQQSECFHWSNLAPMWALDNLTKGAREHPSGLCRTWSASGGADRAPSRRRTGSISA